MQIISKQKIKTKFNEHHKKSISFAEAIKKTATELGINEETVERVARLTIDQKEAA